MAPLYELTPRGLGAAAPKGYGSRRVGGSLSTPESPNQFTNGLATAALLLALVGFGLAFIPFIGIFGIPLALLSVPMALSAKARSLSRYRAGYGRSIAALVIAGLALVTAVMSTFLWRSSESPVQRSVENPIDLERNDLNRSDRRGPESRRRGAPDPTP